MQVEVTKEFDVTAEQFYDFMVKSICEQIQEELNLEVDPAQIKAGYTHKVKSTTKDGNVEKIRYTIKEAKRAEKFVTVFTSAKRKTRCSYTFIPTDKGCKFIYAVDINFADSKYEPKGFKGKMAMISARNRAARQVNASYDACKKDLKEQAKENKRLAKEARKEAARENQKSEA